MKEAMFYETLEHMKVQCRLCPNNCVILHGKRGSCKVRENRMGKLYSLVYGLPCSTAIDPIEKKPLFHFLPGSKSYSIATPGCNLHCKFCQNWQISQSAPEDVRSFHMDPQEVVDAAVRSGAKSIAFTYVEPSIFYEYMLDIAKLARAAGLKTVMVTNGYINPAPARKLFKYIDALNIDLKGFTEQYYKEICSGSLKPVLATIKLAKKMKLWVELTTLIVPGFNDNEEELSQLYAWVKKELGMRVPVHISRFFPYYKMNHLSATPIETLEKAFAIARRDGMKYVYLGNVHIEDTEDTFCPKCGRKVIERGAFYTVAKVHVVNGKCRYCGGKIDGVFMKKKVGKNDAKSKSVKKVAKSKPPEKRSIRVSAKPKKNISTKKTPQKKVRGGKKAAKKTVKKKIVKKKPVKRKLAKKKVAVKKKPVKSKSAISKFKKKR